MKIGPYLAVIVDSFRAALSSRVLWIAFLAIWLLLAALAPIGYREDYTTTFRWRDFESGTQLKQELGRALVTPGLRDTPAGSLAAAMPERLQLSLERVGNQEEVRIPLREFADAFNELLENESWYDAETWEGTLQLRELRELNEASAEELSESLRRRRARLRIEAAFPGVFRSRSARSILFTYAGADFPANVAVDKPQFISLINQWVMPTLINWLLGFVLVFLGILVTASIVPDMLQAGSLHLLLSKPVARPLLLISKFVGGCAFVLLCVTQLVIGLWLIAGLRLDIWNARLLWCIPVSVFLFSVFYSVSVLAGLRWRSPILAIGVTCIFGAITLVTGIIGGISDEMITRPQSIRSLAVAGESLVGATRGGGLVTYRVAESESWKAIIESDAFNRDRIFPPVDIGEGLVVTANSSGGRLNPYGSGAIDLLVLRPDVDEEPQPTLRLPRATTRIYRCGPEHLLAEHTGGLQITKRKSIVEALGVGQQPDVEEANPEEKQQGALSGILSGLLGARSRPEAPAFEPILPERTAILSPSAIIPAADGTAIHIVTRNRLLRLDRPAEGAMAVWSLGAETGLPGEASASLRAARSGQVLLIARAEEPLRFFDADSLQPVGQLPLPPADIPIAVTELGQSGRFAIVTSDGLGMVVASEAAGSSDAELPVFTLERPLPHSDIESVSYDATSNQLAVVHHVDRVDLLHPKSLEPVAVIRPELESWRFVDYYVVRPLRAVIPQTGELGETVTAIISGKSAFTIERGPGNEDEMIRYQIARPVISCAAFITVMLTIGCVYFSRRDF